MSFTTFPRYQKKWGHSFTSLKDISNDSSQPPSQPSPPQQQQQQQKQESQQQQQQQQQQTTTPAVAQPRFSVFSKKPRFTSLKQQQQQEEQQPIVKEKEIEAKDLKPTQPASPPAPEPEPAPRKFIKKFELHSKGINSNVAAANEQEEQEKQQLLSKKENDQQDLSADIMTIQTGFHTNNNNNNINNKKKKKSVHFDPWFLERVCLFTQTQIPNLLKSAHDKRLENPTFRIICPHWPRYSKQEEKTNTIMLDKKSVSVAKDNKSIKGKILVRNLALDKSVSVRYTFNGWNTVNDVDATFFGPYPKNPLYDIYEFSIRFGHGQLADRGEMRGKIEFSVQLTADNRDYIDNNTGRNYLIRVIADPLNNPWDGDDNTIMVNDSMNNTVENMSNNNNNNNNSMSDNVSDSGSTNNEQEDDDEDDREEMYYREHEVASEKDSSFTNALKGYKHARPLHLSKRQPWLGTRYDFSHSLSLAKKACTIYSNGSAELPKIEPMINASDYFLQQPTILSPQEEKEQDKEASKAKSCPKIGGPCYSSTPLFDSKRLSPPPSPSLSPTHPPAFPMTTDLCTLIDVDSNYYLDLLNKYCFYTSSSSTSTEQTFFPISSNS